MAERYYQKEQLSCTKRDYDAGLRRLLISAATGVGKTVYMSKLPKYLNLGGMTIVLVHRDELAHQTADKMKRENPTFKIGVEMGESYADLDCDVIVAGVATLGTEQGAKRLQRFDPKRVSIVQTDEAHHSTAETYIRVYTYFGILDEQPRILLVGVTATPGRGDGVPLAKVYQTVTHSYPIRKAIEDGFLVDIRVLRLLTGTDISNIKAKGGDFNVSELSDTINTPGRNQQFVKAWSEHARDYKTIAFCADIQHSKDMAAMFRHYGYKFEAVWGVDKERAWKIARHKGPKEIAAYCAENGLPTLSAAEIEDLTLEGLTNADVLTEGYDDPNVRCVINASPSKSQTKVAQRVGRCTRLQAGVNNLKEALAAGWAIWKNDALVIDGVDASSRISLATVPSIFGLAADIDLKDTPATIAIKMIEEAEAANPHVDFSKLESIDKIKATVEEASFWDEKYPPEVEANSKLGWHRAADGSFIIQIPKEKDEEEDSSQGAEQKKKGKPSWMTAGEPKLKGDHIRVKENVLGKWELKGLIAGIKYKGIRDTIEKVFAAADQLIITKAGHALKILKREAEWHDGEVTTGQKRMLGKLLKGRPIPPSLTKGQASKLISRILAGKVTGKVAA